MDATPSTSSGGVPGPSIPVDPTKEYPLVCNACSVPVSVGSGNLIACTSCLAVAYCCREHQIVDYARHAPLCVTLTRRKAVLSSGVSTISSASSGHYSSSSSEAAAAGALVPSSVPVSSSASSLPFPLASLLAATTENFNHIILPSAAVSGGNAAASLASLLAQQQQQQQSAPPPPPPPQLDMAALLQAAGITGNFPSTPAFDANTLSQLLSLVSASSGAGATPSVMTTAPPPPFDPSLLLGTTSSGGGLILPPLPAMSNISNLLSGVPHPSSFPSVIHPDSASLGPAIRRPTASPLPMGLPSKIPTSSSSVPRFDLGAAEATSMMTNVAISNAARASPPSASPAEIAARPKAVPARTRGSDSPATATRKIIVPGADYSHILPPGYKEPKTMSGGASTSSGASSTSSFSSMPSLNRIGAVTSTPVCMGARKRGTPSPPGGKELKTPAGSVVPNDDDDDIQVIHTQINRKYKDHSKNVIYNVTMAEHMQNLMNKGMAVNTHQAMVLRLRYTAEHVISSLNNFGWAVVDNFLGTEHVNHINKEMEKLYEKGLFTAGQLMESASARDESSIKDIRSDYIYWYDGVDARAQQAKTLRVLISMIDSLIMHFDDRIDGRRIGGRSRAMCAIYPGNTTRYVKHVDNPNNDGRLITCIYYCNHDWNMEKHGGALRLYPESCQTAMDVDPQADRVVFFWSDRRNPHEVMPVHRHRFAITIWYMDREERLACIKKKEEADRAKAAEAVGGLSLLSAGAVETQQGVRMVKAEPMDEQPFETHEPPLTATALVTQGEQEVFGLGPSSAKSLSLRPSHASAPEMAHRRSGGVSPIPTHSRARLMVGAPEATGGQDSNMPLSRSAHDILQPSLVRPAAPSSSGDRNEFRDAAIDEDVEEDEDEPMPLREMHDYEI